MLLVIITGYLTVFTFVGLVYKKWVTPVTDSPGVYNTRTGLGPWSNRIGVLAFALIPLSVLLTSRESILSLITGIPYQHFNFLHRWLGYIIYVQSVLHTIGWVIVEGKLYQPQPTVWDSFIAQTYMIWGVVAMIFLSLLFFFSTPWAIKRTGYEVFRKAHYIVAMLFIGACWGHWAQLYCWLLASLVVWFVDRGARLLRTALLHYGYVDGSMTKMGFQTAKANVTMFPDATNGDVVRLDFEHNHQPWKVGQHFYLCFPESSIWQSHPFTPSSLPASGNALQSHSYIMRAKSGETRKLAEKMKARAALLSGEKRDEAVTTPVILAGPYGLSTIGPLKESTDVNVMCIAGGSGVTFVLPVLLHLVRQPETSRSDRKIELVCAVRRRCDLEWIRSELNMLHSATKKLDLKIRIFITREDEVDTTTAAEHSTRESPQKQNKQPSINIEEDKISENSDSTSAAHATEKHPQPRASFSIQRATHTAALSPSTRHPDLHTLINDFVASTIRGPTIVYASGPGGMTSDLRSIVAGCNDGAKVLRGDERGDVSLVCDDRLEW